jgi:hypothetical protein
MWFNVLVCRLLDVELARDYYCHGIPWMMMYKFCLFTKYMVYCTRVDIDNKTVLYGFLLWKYGLVGYLISTIGYLISSVGYLFILPYMYSFLLDIYFPTGYVFFSTWYLLSLAGFVFSYLFFLTYINFILSDIYNGYFMYYTGHLCFLSFHIHIFKVWSWPLPTW